jgi:hypothetical protein
MNKKIEDKVTAMQSKLEQAGKSYDMADLYMEAEVEVETEGDDMITYE